MPSALFFDVTLNCMLDCPFCSRKPVKKEEKRMKSLDEFVEVLDRHDVRQVFFTGGEPLLNENLCAMIKYAKKRGREVNVQTNGVLLGSKAEKLKEAGVDGVFVSIHSHIPELEYELTGRVMEDVLERKMKGMSVAHSHGLRVFPVTVITSLNYRILPEMVEHFLARFPWIIHWVFNFIDPAGFTPQELVPKYSDVEPFLLKALSLLSRKGKNFRVERVPLCYMVEFAEYSTEARRIFTGTKTYGTVREEQEFYTDPYWKREYVRGEACRHCFWKNLCPGINRRYAEIHGTSEVYPIFSPEGLLRRRLGED